jgi:predicted dehydrogenase
LSDPNVKGVLINIFGGITRGDEVARGIIEGTKMLNVQVPIVVRLAGTNAEKGWRYSRKPTCCRPRPCRSRAEDRFARGQRLGGRRKKDHAMTVKFGIIGSGFVADIHAHAIQKFVPEAEVVAVASPTSGKASRFARERGIPHAFEDYRELLALPDVDVVTLALPNDLHCRVTLDAARAGKHVVCEKPLCRTLAEADEMIATCREKGVLLLYAEELLFAPKYVRAKQLVDEGALGEPFLVKQSEEHDGPHGRLVWDVNRSGGGVLLDMGCHSIEYARWIFGKPKGQKRVGDARHLRSQGQNTG